MPFSRLSNYQLSIELSSSKCNIKEMLESHDFNNKLKESVPREILDNVIKCKYYDDKEFNSISKCSNSLLSIIHVNLQSSFKNFALLRAHLYLLDHKFDIIAISEAGRGNKDRCAYIMGDNYMYEYCEPTLAKGGVALYIKKEISYTRRHDLEIKDCSSIEHIWYEFMVKDKSYIGGVVYHHPGYSTDIICQYLERNLTTIAKEKKFSVVCDDMNINLFKPNLMQTHNTT